MLRATLTRIPFCSPIFYFLVVGSNFGICTVHTLTYRTHTRYTPFPARIWCVPCVLLCSLACLPSCCFFLYFAFKERYSTSPLSPVLACRFVGLCLYSLVLVFATFPCPVCHLLTPPTPAGTISRGRATVYLRPFGSCCVGLGLALYFVLYTSISLSSNSIAPYYLPAHSPRLFCFA